MCAFVCLQSRANEVQQRFLPGPVRALPRGQVHTDQAPLVVEGKPSVQPAGGHTEPRW